jgi:hypothetical protein
LRSPGKGLRTLSYPAFRAYHGVVLMPGTKAVQL